MTIVIVYRLDTNEYTIATCKETGRNGRRKNIGTGTVIKAVVGTGIKAMEDMVIRSVVGTMIRATEGMVIRTADTMTGTIIDTRNGVKWMMD